MELTGGNKCLYVCKEQVYEPAPVSYMDRADRSNGMVQKEQIQK